MAHGKVGVSKDKMCSYKHTHNGAVHNDTKADQEAIKNGFNYSIGGAGSSW